MNGERGLAQEQVTRSDDTLPQHVCMRRNTQGLAEGAFEAACTHAGEFGESAQSDSMCEVLFDVLQDKLETPRRQAAGGRRRWRCQRRMRVDDVMSEELACALGVDRS